MDDNRKLESAQADEIGALRAKVMALEAERDSLQRALAGEKALRRALVDATPAPTRDGVNSDCTRAIEERLNALQAIVNRSPVMLFRWRFDPGNWPIEYVSDSVESILGYSVDDLKAGRVTLNAITHPEDIPRLEAEVAAFRAKGLNEWSQSYRLIGKSGVVIWVRDWNRVIADASGAPAHVQGVIVDVTALHEAEEELRRGEAESRRTVEMLNTLLHAAPTPVVVLDVEDRVKLWSKAAEQLFGWTEAEVLGRTSPLVPPERRGEARLLRASVVAGEPTPERETLCLHKNGSRVPVLLYISPLPVASGAVTDALCVFVDNTHRKALQQERERLIHQLQSERLRLSAVLEHMPAGAFIAEAPSGRIVMANEAAARIWQMPFTPAEKVADYPPMVGYRADGTQYEMDDWPLVRSLKRGEVVRNEEIRIVRGDGGCAVILASSAPIRDNSGRITSAAVVFIDITDLVRTRDQLGESEARYRSLVEHLPGATYSTPLNDLNTATYVSPQVEALTGYSAEEFREKPGLWRSLYLPEDRERLAAESRRFERHKRPTTFDYRIRRKDGAVLWIRDEANFVRDEKGRPVCVQGIIMDNTARMLEREERRREQRLLIDSQRIARTGSWQMNFQTGELWWTRETYRIFGLDPRRTRPSLKLAWELVHPEDVATVRKTLEKATEEHTPYSILHRMVRPDGREITVHAAGSIAYDKANRPLLLTGTIRDITEWNDANRERRALAQLIENSSDMISMSDLKGRLTFVNESARRALGISRRQLDAGLAMAEITDPSCVPLLHNTIVPTAMSVGHWEGELQLRNLRTRRPVEGYASVFQVRAGDVGQAHAIAAIIRETRERRQAEQAVLAAADREQQRIGMDLHDMVGQTLTGAGMLAAMLERKLTAQSLPEADQAGRISKLLIEATNQTRELARGLCPVSDGPEALRAALCELAKSTREVYGIDCSARAAADALVDGAVTAGQMYFIAREAVGNAVKHGQAKTIRIHLRRADHGFELRVEDDGKGFAQGAQDKGGLGFRTMRYRAGVIGAQLSLELNSTGGVTVRCLIPENRLTSTRPRQEAKT